MRFVVQRKEGIINVIIPHNNKYTLLTSKALNFNTFKEVAEILANVDHLKNNKRWFKYKIILKKVLWIKRRPFEELFNHYSATEKTKIKSFFVTRLIAGVWWFRTIITQSKDGKIVTRNRCSGSASTHT